MGQIEQPQLLTCTDYLKLHQSLPNFEAQKKKDPSKHWPSTFGNILILYMRKIHSKMSNVHYIFPSNIFSQQRTHTEGNCKQN